MKYTIAKKDAKALFELLGQFRSFTQRVLSEQEGHGEHGDQTYIVEARELLEKWKSLPWGKEGP